MRNILPMPNRGIGVDILFYAEDAGAANFIVHLPKSCLQKGLTTKVIIDGAAQRFFLDAGVDFEKIDSSFSARDILEILGPRLVVVGTSENRKSPGLSMVDEARRLGIPSIGIVDAYMNADRRFRGISEDPLRHCPDWLIVPDEWTKDAYISIGCSHEQIAVCGHPQYDFVREKGELFDLNGTRYYRKRYFPKLDGERTVAVFAAEKSEGLDPAHLQVEAGYTLAGRGGSAGRTETVLEEFLDALESVPERPYLVLRLSPKNTTVEFAPYADSFDQVSQDDPVLELIYAADCVIGMTSMLLLEAAILGKPTFSIVPRESEREWLPSIRAGLTDCVSTRQQLLSQLPTFLKESSEGASLPMPHSFPFGALERSVSFMRSLIS